MRSLARADGGPGLASFATTDGLRPLAADDPAAPLPRVFQLGVAGLAGDAASTVNPSASAAATLAERLARLGIEEVEPRDVDCDGHLFGESQLDVRREPGDEIRP